MICPSCKQETEEGKFCTSCGAQLTAEKAETAATAEPTPTEAQPTEQVNQTVPPQQPAASQTQSQEPNEYVEKAKALGVDFGQFCLTLIKRPSEARTTNGNSLIPGIITIILFALLISLDSYISIARVMDSAPFFDGFIVPLFKYIVMFAAIAAITFAAAKVALQDISITDIAAKYGAYMMPFILLFLVNILFNLVKLNQEPFSMVGIISVLGPVLVVPVLIITERAVKGLDLVYTIVGLSLINFIIYSYLATSAVLSNVPSLPSIPGL